LARPFAIAMSGAEAPLFEETIGARTRAAGATASFAFVHRAARRVEP